MVEQVFAEAVLTDLISTAMLSEEFAS